MVQSFIDYFQLVHVTRHKVSVWE